MFFPLYLLRFTYEILNEFNYLYICLQLDCFMENIFMKAWFKWVLSLKKIDLFKDKVIETRFLDKQYGEGLTIINNKYPTNLKR